MVKYAKRGFKFEINALRYLNDPHCCMQSSSCPHTYWHLWDVGVLAISFHDNEISSKEFVGNAVDGTYNGGYGIVWCMGGDPCKVSDPLPLVTDSYLMQMRFH